MPGPVHEETLSEAIGWRIRLRDGGAGDADWEAFAAWLDGDPARSDAYDRVARADEGIAPGMVPVASMAAPAGVPRRTFAWAAAVAALLIALLALPWLTAPPDRYEIATAPGARRTVALADGGSVALNGATRLILDRGDARFAELVTGEATFTIRHDARRPFELVAGEHRLRDSGTIFNVVRDGDRFAVEVIEGAVIYNPGAEAVALAAGRTLARRGGGRLLLARAEPARMAGWRRGQLSYRNAPLDTVARDLSRSLGAEIAVAPALAARPFTGSIRVEASDAATVAALAATLGAAVRRQDDGWLIEPQAHAPR